MLKGLIVGLFMGLIGLIINKIKGAFEEKEEDRSVESIESDVFEEKSASPNKSQEEIFLKVIEPYKSVRSIAIAWSKFDLREKYAQADKMIEEERTNEKKNREINEFAVYDLKKALPALLMQKN